MAISSNGMKCFVAARKLDADSSICAGVQIPYKPNNSFLEGRNCEQYILYLISSSVRGNVPNVGGSNLMARSTTLFRTIGRKMDVRYYLFQVTKLYSTIVRAQRRIEVNFQPGTSYHIRQHSHRKSAAHAACPVVGLRSGYTSLLPCCLRNYRKR